MSGGDHGERARLDVLVFGEVIVDFFPERPGPSLVDVEVFRRHLGGAPANVAIGIARQGSRAALMTLVGPDDFGRYARSRLSDEGVDVSPLGTHPTAKTAITFVSVTEAGERSFMFFRHPSADQSISPEHVDPAHIARANVFHFGSSTMAREPGRAATLHAVDAARAAGLVLSMDPNFRRHLWPDPDQAIPLIRRLIAVCDLVKVADDELLALVGTDDPVKGARALRQLGAKLVVVTLGPKGCYYDAPAGRGMVPGEPVTVVDTTGAGDGFVAGLLSSLAPCFERGARIADLDTAAVRSACVRGNHLGSRVVTALGATTALPRSHVAADVPPDSHQG